MRLAVIDKLSWIRRQKAKFDEQLRQSQREMVSGESHYFPGRRHRLRVHGHDVGVQVAAWGIKRMKTKWGSCNPASQRIWFNLELAKAPIPCIEYIVVHELVHLLERHHNDHFAELVEKYIPQWREYRERLNKTPLRSEE